MITALIWNGLFLFVPALPVLQYSRLFQYQKVPDVDTKELVELIEAVDAGKGLSLDPSVDGAGGIQIQLLLDVGWRKRRALMSVPIRSPVFSLLMMTTLMARFSCAVCASIARNFVPEQSGCAVIFGLQWIQKLCPVDQNAAHALLSQAEESQEETASQVGGLLQGRYVIVAHQKGLYGAAGKIRQR